MATPYERSPFFIPATGAKPLTEQDIADYDSFMVEDELDVALFASGFALDSVKSERL